MRTEAIADFDWRLPAGFSPPAVPESNVMNAAKVELGRRLFYDTRLSVNGQGNCGSCHQQRLAFTDSRSQAIGVTGESHQRSSMSLVNVAYNRNYTWASRDVRTLEQQIRIPLFNEDPVELGLTGRENALIADLKSGHNYSSQFEQAFPLSAEPVNVENTIKALASFVRTIISAESAFDRLLYLDDQTGMSDSAMRGMRLFYSDKLKCSACHEGPNLAGGQQLPDNGSAEPEFHNTGLGASDPGLRIESGHADDDGKFRAPTLRNIAITAPYMHDGSIATLAEVMDHYAAGGRSTPDGKKNLRKSPLMTGFEISATQKQELISFLESLTDYKVLDDGRFSAPEMD